MIGPYLTEINVTSPTGIRQVKAFGGADIAALIWDAIERKVKTIGAGPASLLASHCRANACSRKSRRSIMANIKILGIAGSLRKASFNQLALKAAQGLVPAGATLEILELPDLPGLQPGQREDPAGGRHRLKAKIRAADAILFVTPEYNYSIPGVLKNAIDWCARPYGDSAWKGKPVAIMGASDRRARHRPARSITCASAWCSSTCPRSTSPR